MILIKDAYVKAFSQDEDDVMEYLNDKSIDFLSACRNVLVHNAGIVDEVFVERICKVGIANTYVVGQPIELSPDVVAKTIDDAIDSASRLILAVSHWIETH